MNKIVFLIGVIVLVLVSSCANNEKTYNDCMMGCTAGMNYDGSEIVVIDIDNIDDEKLKEFVACENFCKSYVEIK